MINDENWTFCKYVAADYQAILSIGGEYIRDNEYLEVFYVNKTQSEELVFQNKFESLQDAIVFINKTYGHWDFVNAEISKNNSGCSSCQAH